MKQLVAGLTVAFAICASLYCWGNTYVTVATNDPHAYVPYLIRAFVSLGAAELVLISTAVLAKSLVRFFALALALANCMPIYHAVLRVPYVFS